MLATSGRWGILMGLSSILPLVGGVAAATAGRAAVALGQGLSFAEQLVARPTTPALPTTATPEQPSTRQLIADLQALLQPRLAAAGIDASLPFELRLNGRGRVDEISGHPDRAYIEELFLDDPALTAKFQELNHRVREEEQQQRALSLHPTRAPEPVVVVEGPRLKMRFD